MTAMHKVPREPWSRRKKVTWLVIGFFVLATAAVAAYLVSKGLTGTVTGGTFQVNLVSAVHDSGNCTITKSGEAIDILWDASTGGAPVAGDRCNFTATYENDASSSGSLILQAINVPSGLIATTGDANDCAGAGAISVGASRAFALTYEFDGTVTNITFGAGDQVDFVRPAEWAAGLCPGVTS